MGFVDSRICFEVWCIYDVLFCIKCFDFCIGWMKEYIVVKYVGLWEFCCNVKVEVEVIVCICIGIVYLYVVIYQVCFYVVVKVVELFRCECDVDIFLLY